jgi:hypothetical protein
MGNMSLDDFLGHKTGSQRGTFLKNWKGRPEHSVNVWLHRKSPFSCVWRHNMSRVIQLKEGGTDVWGANWVCWEDEETLKSQFKRDDGDRVMPPTKCPICKMLEWIYQEIAAERLSWTEPVFRFEGDDPDHNITYHAGGLVGLYGRRDITDEEKRQLKKERIFLKDAWKEVATAKANYVFCIVEHDSPKDGVQITIEPSLLGDKLKAVIRHALKGKGSEHGDPRKHPYAFEFSFHPEESEFGKKYDVCPLEAPVAPLSKTIDELISGDPPDTSSVTKPFDADTVRMELEEHALIDIPWDDFFPPSRATAQQAKPAAKQVDSEPDGDDEEIVCDKCGKKVTLDDTTCPHCGHVFDDAEPEPPPPPPKPKTRAEVMAERSRTAKPPEPKPAPKSLVKPVYKGGEVDPDFTSGESDELPF